MSRLKMSRLKIGLFLGLFLGLFIIQIGFIRAEDTGRGYVLLGSDERGSILEAGVVLETMTRIVSDVRGLSYWEYGRVGDGAERLYSMIKNRHAFAIIDGSSLLELLRENEVVGSEIRQIAVLWREALHGFIAQHLVQTGNFSDLRALEPQKIGFVGTPVIRNRIEEQVLINLGFRNVTSWQEFREDRENHLEGIVFVAGVPNILGENLIKTDRWRLLRLSDRQVAEVSEKTDKAWSARNFTGLSENFNVITKGIYIVGLDAIPQKIVYELTSLLFTERCYLESMLGLFRAMPTVTEQLSSVIEGLKLHEGARKFYQEKINRKTTICK